MTGVQTCALPIYDRLTTYIGDVRNYKSVDFAMAGVDYIFHAAALKQVPSCEFYPMEAVLTNILGADNVLSAAIAHGVEKMIILSTDKAVYPINAMGMTKALMEKIMVAKSRTVGAGKTILCGTRYGNVIASRGSVIPLFIKQLKHGKPLTVTDPNMTRFLMSMDDALDLVLHAFREGDQGDILVRKAPASTILDLAVAIKEIFVSDNKIEIIGTRHGEKLFETLLTREELAQAQDCGDYYRIMPDDRGLNYKKYLSDGEKQITLSDDYNSHNTTRLDVEQVKEMLLSLDYIRHELTAPE